MSGRVGEVPQVVLDEPQHRVGEHVVEAVVGLRVAHHQPHLELAAGRRLHRERPSPVPFRGLGVVLVHRRGDPDRVAVRGEAGERRHQAARAALDLAVRVEGHRPAVGHQHQRDPPCRCVAHGLLQLVEDPQVVAQVARHQEMRAHVLLAAPAQRLAERGVAQHAQGPLGALLDARHQIAGDPVLDLQRYAAHVAADERPRLPDRLRDRQPEALARGLLDEHVGVGLERVDLDRPDVVEVVEDVDVRVAVGVGDRGVEEVPPLRVVGGHRAHQRELHLWHRLP